jgi:hemoglobin
MPQGMMDRMSEPPPEAPSEPLRPAGPTPTYYDAVGGEQTFRRLVAGFYARVATDPVLRPLYPEQDLGPAEERFRLFLMQYWGGPTTYSEQRGHPRLRMRHAPFAIGPEARDAWLDAMGASLVDLDLPDDLAEPLWQYLVNTAYAMQNQP